ncbi:MAG TPA: glycosyltransferase family 9 protein [Longimicrobiaceae bacterium]|nr:glycosyltransferase family 9 protein [Longimicrobiaceae bacterium]
MTERSLGRVCIVMLTAVGDAVHVLPVVNSIRRHAPGTHLTWVLQPGPAALVRGHPAVDEIVVFERRRGLRGFLQLRRALAHRRFDRVLLLQPYLKAAVIAGMARAPEKWGLDRARARDLSWLFTNRALPPRPPQHVQDQFLEFLDALGIPRVLSWEGLEPTAAERAAYAGILPPSDRPTVALVVGTSKPEKEWPAERYAAAADRLAEELGARTVLVGGRSPRELAARDTILRLAQHPPLDALEWDLRRLVYLIDRADVLVSPDTGPLHVGVALGTPTVALMGYTNPRRYGPYRRFRELLVDAFGDPGEDYPLTARHRPGRMERITVEEVVEKVRLALARYGVGSASSGADS